MPAYREFGSGENNLETSDPDWPMDKSNAEYMADRVCRISRFVTIASDVYACLSGATIALVAINHLIERTIKIEPSSHTMILEATELHHLSPLQAT